MSLQMKKQVVILVLVMAALAVTAYIGLGAASPLGSSVASGDTRELTNPQVGYAVRYPAGYTVEQPNDNTVLLVVDSIMNHVDERAHIEVTPADGRTAAQVADKLVAEVEANLPGYKVERSQITVGGQPAVVLNKLPGQELNRVVLMAHNGRLYQMMFLPADETRGEAYERMEKLYATVIDSFRLLQK